MKKAKGRNGKLLPNSLRIISSCIKTVSTNASTAVRSAGASVAASISYRDDRKEQVLWAGFDKLELTSSSFRRVLLLGYVNGFQIFDVEDASGLSELVSRRDGPVTFLQMLPPPGSTSSSGKYKSVHPIVVVVGGHGVDKSTITQAAGLGHEPCGSTESSCGSSIHPPCTVRFYSMKSNEYVKIIDFKSVVLMVRCSSQAVAIGLEEQIFCFDTLSLEKKFVVMTYPVPQLGEPGSMGINTGYGPMAVGTRWLAYPPNRPFLKNVGRISPRIISTSVTPSSSPQSGTMMARYAVESTKHLASGLFTLGDMGYKKLTQYYPDLLQDGSGKMVASEAENAGLVAVRDLVCSDVILQFRAHKSSISALCFDPSGTLLVTASVHGNSINVFRIMPFHKCDGSDSDDWKASYVHLFKLYRGMTNAVIQDICFSQCSQWIAVVSSRGTCHIFVMSPFGGDVGFRSSCGPGGNFLSLVPSPPWWSTSLFTVNEQNPLPPSTRALSVVARIKCSDSGLLNSVSNAASSVVGKIWIPHGAVAAVFLNSQSTASMDVKLNSQPLGQIMVYTPSSFVVQHEIKLHIGSEMNDSEAILLASQPENLNQEVRVKVEPLRWWDVCRKLDNMEREASFSGCIYDGPDGLDDSDYSKTGFQDKMCPGEKKSVMSNPLNSPGRSHWYLSNAEVQIKSCRVPIWQKTIHFHVLESPQVGYDSNGEFEIEMVSSHEVEIKHRDLLPIFENFCRVQPGAAVGSVSSGQKYPIASTKCFETRKKSNEASIMCHSKPPSCSSTESSEGGSSWRMENLLDLEHTSLGHLNSITGEGNISRFSPKDQKSGGVFLGHYHEESCNDNATISLPSSSLGNESPSTNANSDVDALQSSTHLEDEAGLGLLHNACSNNTRSEFDEHENTQDEEGWIGETLVFPDEG